MKASLRWIFYRDSPRRIKSATGNSSERITLALGKPATPRFVLSLCRSLCTPKPLAEQVHFRKVEDLIAASTEHGFQHENPEALDLIVGDGWRHRKLLMGYLNLD